MKEIYNIVAIVSPDEEGQEKKEKIKELIKKEANFLFDKEIGEQKLAYEIEDLEKGYYFWVDFDIEKDGLKKLEDKIRKINPLRILISKKSVEAVKRQKEEVEERLESKEASSSPKKEKEKTSKKKSTSKKTKKSSKDKDQKESKKEEKERMKDLDQKLEELL